MRKLVLSLPLFPLLVFAEPLPNHLPANIQTEVKVAQPQFLMMPKVIPQRASEEINLSDQELAQNPLLIHQFLIQATEENQPQLIPDLVAMYRKYTHHDKVLVQYAEGIYQHSQGNYAQAIAIYRQLLAENPNAQKVRFRLAQWLFEDNQLEAAKDQFNKINSEPHPAFVGEAIESYKQALARKQDWKMRFGVSYLQDNNVNNASSEKIIYLGGKPFVKNADSLPQKARGLSYSLFLSKLFNLTGYHNLYWENTLNGKWYHHQKEYNDLTAQISFGYQYENAKWRMALLPFYEKRWYGNQPYTNTHGLRLETDYQLSNQWQFSSAVEYHQSRYQLSDKKMNTQLYSATLLYLANAKRYYYVGSDFITERGNEHSDESNKVSLRVGWGQEWLKGISTRISVQYAKRHFKHNHYFARKKRVDNEWNLGLTLWKRDWHFLGITPKLQLNYQKTQSNIPAFYAFDKFKSNLLFEKTF